MSNIFQLIQKHANYSSKSFVRRGVAPIIATLLLVAIAVVGGSMIFVFAQGFVSETQISGTIEPEYVKIIGYDTRDTTQLKAHDGEDLLPNNCCGVEDGIKNPDERIAIHIQNNSAKSITISELRFGGTEYNYTTSVQLGNWNGGVGPQPNEYVIMTGHDGNAGGDIIQESSSKVQAGGIVTLVLDLDRTILDQRDVQIKLTTVNGNVFISTLIFGQISS